MQGDTAILVKAHRCHNVKWVRNYNASENLYIYTSIDCELSKI